MTRINVVPVEELCNQHLLAEWRELPRMAHFARTTKNPVIPEKYCLGAGHMKFFLDKGSWLEVRHKRLTIELLDRGFDLTILDYFIMPPIYGNIPYVPDDADVLLNRMRIMERMPKNATWV